MDEITLAEYVESEIQRLRIFAAFWVRSQNECGKDPFPDFLPPGDWDQQFVAFCDTRYT